MPIRHLAVSLLLVCASLATAAPAFAEGVRASVQVSFSGTSTLHNFKGTAGSVAVALSQTANGAWSAEVNVPAAAMDTGNGWRDGDMREMLGAARNPQILGRFRDLDPDQVRSSGVLPFVLRIRTVERPVRVAITNWKQSDREASFDASFEVSLQSFQLEAPQAFFLSVGDIVRVTVHVTLERE
jgi:polyisoprenoid-binding protein YceI